MGNLRYIKRHEVRVYAIGSEISLETKRDISLVYELAHSASEIPSKIESPHTLCYAVVVPEELVTEAKIAVVDKLAKTARMLTEELKGLLLRGVISVPESAQPTWLDRLEAIRLNAEVLKRELVSENESGKQ